MQLKIAITVILIIFMLPFAHAQTQPADSETSALNSDAEPLPLEQIKIFAEIFTLIKQNYIEPVSDDQLLNFAIKGMLHGLDPHSVYLTGDNLTELKKNTLGQLDGLGIEFVTEGDFLKIIAPLDSSPAQQAGILSGDLIMRIDGKAVSGLSLQEVVQQMRGEPGSQITLTILREPDFKPFDLLIKRATVRFSSVRSRELNDQIAYFRVARFDLASTENFRKELEKRQGFAGLIIDLRNNPGGLLSSAVSMADLFIKDGVIVSTKGRIARTNQEFTATPFDVIDGKPIIVLVNGGSASASEIVAGALQDHQRAVILGTETFGKGSVQARLNVREDKAIKLTTSRYYTPNGTSIQAAGIVPDVLVAQRQFKADAQPIERVKEQNLPRTLANDERPNTQKVSATIAQILKQDYQLNEAFNLLKGIVLYQTKLSKD